MKIEDYALLGDTHSAALVARDGSIDWLCLPRFDSPSCFAAILDPEVGGHWRIAPAGEDVEIDRRYRDSSMVLETTFRTSEGTVTLVDCLPLEEASDPRDPSAVYPEHVVVRMVRGDAGTVPMVMEYAPRFDYGRIRPWLRTIEEGGVEAIGGPDALQLQADVDLEIDECTVRTDFEVSEGDCVAFAVCYYESHRAPRTDLRPEQAGHLVELTDRFWRDWIECCRYGGEWQDAVERSLLVLKALTYSPTGGLVAAATTSLPESIGGVRNWDYRFCWLRDATFTLEVLMDRGFMGEAEGWRDWLLRAVAGDPDDLQIMYGVKGERRLTEIELDWLAGYEGSRPVRIGNAAVDQFQLDVYGEVMDALHSARRAGLKTGEDYWALQKRIVEFVCECWQEPDEGIWEVRDRRRHFVLSKV
ncbi:MAG: glycoside hydrolase family 15 protein, partial [Actinomycetota bacterium]